MEIQTGIFDTALPPIADDAFLLSLVQSGDEQAVATLFDRYSRIVYSVALRVLSDAALAEDMLQEVFLQLWRTPQLHGGRGKPGRTARGAGAQPLHRRAAPQTPPRSD